jgi:Tol biopolymer transport system component
MFGFILLPNLVFAFPIERVSLDTGNQNPNGNSGYPSLTDDGRFISFESDATDLIGSDGNGVTDIFVYDRTLDTTERVSVSTLGVEADGASMFSRISANDGRYVVFQSNATNLLGPGNDTDGVTDIFVYDRTLDTIELISGVSGLAVADGNSTSPVISADGQYVAFQSTATNLVGGDTNSVSDIFVYDRTLDVMQRVSVSTLGVEADTSATTASISADGRYVAFVSAATTLVATDTNGFHDVFVYDRDQSTLEIVSVDGSGNEVNNLSTSEPIIAADGSYVAYVSGATNIVAGDTEGIQDVFFYNRGTGVSGRASKSDAGIGENANPQEPAISSQGYFVAFSTPATNLIGNDFNSGSDVYVYNRVANTIKRISVDAAGNEVSGGNAVQPSISADGRFIVFTSGQNNLAPGDVASLFDIFIVENNLYPTNISLSDSFLEENQNQGTTVGTFTTADANTDDTHTYSFTCTIPGTNDSSFTISGTTLKSAAEFDYEEKFSYSICIRTTDTFGGIYDKNFTISIHDVSESSGGSSAPVAPSPVVPPPVTLPPVVPPAPLPPNPIPPPVVPSPVVPEPPITTEPLSPLDPISESPSDIPTSLNNEIPHSQFSLTDLTHKIKEEAHFITLGLQEETPRDVAHTISVAGVALPTVAFVVAQPAVAANLVSIPVRLWNLIPIWLGLRRKKRPWGTVYDSVTKQPLDPVYVSLRNLSGKEVATTITDLDGRFGFLVPPGRYTISAKKDNYEFPSKKLNSTENDRVYGTVYDGQEIEIAGEEDLLIKNLPMDSKNFNWNEFEKARNKQLMKFYSKREIFLANIAGVAFWGGLISSLLLLYTGPSPLNYILLGVYAFVLLLRLCGIKPKKPGYVVESQTGFPLSYGIVRIFSTALNQEIAHAVIGKTGKYYILVANGDYYAKIERKVGEDAYEEVFTSLPFRVKKGFIGNNFTI